MERCCDLPSRCVFTLAVLLATLCLFQTPLASNTNNEEVNEATNTNPVTSVNIVSVVRTPVPDSANVSKFSIRFNKRPDVDPSDLYCRIYDIPRLPRAADTLVEEGNNVWLAEFTVNRNAPRGRAFWVYVGSTLDYSLAMEMSNFWRLEESQTVFHVRDISTQPAVEVVYEPGQDALVTVTSPRGVGHPSLTDSPRYFTVFTGVDLLTNEYHFDFEDEDVDILTRNDIERLPDKFQQTFSIHLSDHPASGYMKVTRFQALNTGGYVVLGILTTKYIKVRPSNQTSYLPPGYLDVVYGSYIGMMRGDPVDRFNCGKVSTCKPRCRGVGDTISDLQAFQVLPDGSRRPVAAVHPLQTTSTSKLIYWQLDNYLDDSLQERDTIPFECVAYDAVNGRTVTKPLNVYLLIGALD